MSKKEKDFFEQILDDVKPLKKTKTILNKNQTDLKYYDKIPLKKDTKVKQTNIKTKIKLQEKNIINNDPVFAKKIKKRKILINKKVDLHGFSLSEAEKEFDNTIQSCYSENTRCILFVTGKGLKNTEGNESENKLYYGKIKLNIKNWAQKNQNKEKILYMNDANKEHGGAGACYVYVRKKPITT